MDISRQFVRQKNPCADGFRWFMRHFQEGSDYQPLLEALVAAGRVSDACWLMDQFGPTKAVLEVDALEADGVVFAGSLHVRGPIDVDTVLRIGAVCEPSPAYGSVAACRLAKICGQPEMSAR